MNEAHSVVSDTKGIQLLEEQMLMFQKYRSVYTSRSKKNAHALAGSNWRIDLLKW